MALRRLTLAPEPENPPPHLAQRQSLGERFSNETVFLCTSFTVAKVFLEHDKAWRREMSWNILICCVNKHNKWLRTQAQNPRNKREKWNSHRKYLMWADISMLKSYLKFLTEKHYCDKMETTYIYNNVQYKWYFGFAPLGC